MIDTVLGADARIYTKQLETVKNQNNYFELFEVAASQFVLKCRQIIRNAKTLSIYRFLNSISSNSSRTRLVADDRLLKS